VQPRFSVVKQPFDHGLVALNSASLRFNDCSPPPTFTLDNEPLWVRLYVCQIGERSPAMIVADGVLPPAPDGLKGTALFGATAEEAEQLAHATSWPSP
jgi:hypothetical protein